MAKSVFTARDPNGVEHKRTSDSRTYTHTVVVRPSYEYALASAKEPSGVMARNFAYYVQELGPNPKHSHSDVEFDRMRAEIDGCATAAAYQAKCSAKWVEEVEALKTKGYYDSWLNMGWCGRHDLAVKLASKSLGGVYAEAKILEAVKVK